MNRTVAYLLGPELGWLLLYAITRGIVALYQPLHTDSAKEQLLNFGWFLPTIGVILAFVPLFWAPGSHWVWLTRIGFASAVGILVVITFLCGSVHFNDSRDSGVGTAFIMFIGLGYVALLLTMVTVIIFSLTHWPFLPVLKWVLFIVGVLLAFFGLISWLASLGTSKNP